MSRQYTHNERQYSPESQHPNIGTPQGIYDKKARHNQTYWIINLHLLRLCVVSTVIKMEKHQSKETGAKHYLVAHCTFGRNFTISQ